jgi:hypothetical protein
MKTRDYLIIIMFFVIASQSVSALCAEGSKLEITTLFSAVAPTDLISNSPYQYPDYREDDQMRIDIIYIKNEGECDSENSSLGFNLITPDHQTISAFCNQNIKIPSLKQNESYSLAYQNTSLLTFDNVTYYSDNYIDSFGKEVNWLCKQPLNRVGIWGVSPNLSPLQTWGWNIKSGHWLYGGEFKVKSKLELSSLEQQKKDSNMTFWMGIISVFITAVVGIVGIIVQIWLAKKEDMRRNKYLLNSNLFVNKTRRIKNKSKRKK